MIWWIRVTGISFIIMQRLWLWVSYSSNINIVNGISRMGGWVECLAQCLVLDCMWRRQVVAKMKIQRKSISFGILMHNTEEKYKVWKLNTGNWLKTSYGNFHLCVSDLLSYMKQANKQNSDIYLWNCSHQATKASNSCGTKINKLMSTIVVQDYSLKRVSWPFARGEARQSLVVVLKCRYGAGPLGRTDNWSTQRTRGR